MDARGRLTLGVTVALAIVAIHTPQATAQTPTKAQGKAPATKAPSAASTASAKMAPKFTVDYQWPKPLPSNKLLGSVLGVAVDKQDHVFVVHNVNSFTTRTETGADQTPPIAACCFSEHPVVEFDAAGNRVKSWGGPGAGYEWPAIPGGIAIAPNGNVWITGTGGLDGQILVFSHDGAFIRQIGKAGQMPAAPAGRGAADTAYAGVSPGARGAAPAAGGGRGGGRGGRGAPPPSLPGNSAATDIFGGAMRVSFSADGSMAYIADGIRNRRVVEVDANTGAVVKYWGAYGTSPSDAPMPAYSPTATAASTQFSGVACAESAKDGMIYVCDRGNNRIQVFKSDGSFVKEAKVAPSTLGDGSVWDIAFSSDAAQRFIYVADGASARIRILDRATLTELTAFGEGGRVPGTFYAVGSVAVDSKGNLYTGEAFEGKRVQKFVYGGLAPVTKANQGVLWPARVAK